ncbi:sperm acrosome membrane-associated protein 1 [Leptosomus discolor]
MVALTEQRKKTLGDFAAPHYDTVLLTSGCPGTEAKCIICVEECWGPGDMTIMEACCVTHLVTFQCEIQENGNTIASVKYIVYATTDKLIEMLIAF